MDRELKMYIPDSVRIVVRSGAEKPFDVRSTDPGHEGEEIAAQFVDIRINNHTIWATVTYRRELGASAQAPYETFAVQYPPDRLTLNIDIRHDQPA